jgi:hypothetical protein
MKKPDRIIGFVSYDDIDFPFEFDEKAFLLMLYPPTRDVWEDYSSPVRFFESLKQDLKTHEWISQSELRGMTSEGYHIIFNVQDASSNYHGFINYDVNWYICHSDSLLIDKIDGFKILGHDVDLFYPPQIALESKIEFNEDGRALEKISVTSIKQQFEPCGKYRVSKNIDADVEVTAYASFHSGTSVNPIDAVSSMITTFSVPVGIDTLLDAYFNIRHFFEYITYRKNVDIGDIDLFFKNEKGLRDYSGILVFPQKLEKESHKKLKERIIPYPLLMKNSSRLFTAIKNNALGFQHLCDSIDKMRQFPASRIIMILAAFEREYRNIYGQDSGRSDEYLEVKSEIVSLIEDYHKTNQGKKRKYAKQLKKYVENRDSSFEDHVKYALADCEVILKPFITRKYSGTYAEIIDGISFRMGEVRNGIAHSRLDMNFDAIHLADIRVIEELIYVIRLKNSYINDLECQKAVNQLFGENFGF